MTPAAQLPRAGNMVGAGTCLKAATLPSDTSAGARPESPDEGAAPLGSVLEEQVVQAMRFYPPPRLSQRQPGVTIVPCDLAGLRGTDEIEGETYYCGIFTVPQNWDAPDGRNLDLTFVVARATGDHSEPDPLVFLAGGPGQSAVLSAIGQYDAIRKTRDIVRMDQRGAGLSQRLHLPECLVLALSNEASREHVLSLSQRLSDSQQDEAADSSLPFEPDLGNQIYEMCWEQYARQGLDLNQFSTAAAARDVVELIKALGYKSYNLHGVSYGTCLAMTILRGVPGVEDAPVVRSAVLDSPIPPSISLLASLARNSHDQVLQLLEDCEQDEVCRNAYPNLKQRLHRLLSRLEAVPLKVGEQTVIVSDVVKQLTNLTRTRPGFMPRMIAELEQGVLNTYTALANGAIGNADPEGAPGLNTSDPVQAFYADALAVVAQPGGQEVMFGFLTGFFRLLTQAEPLSALRAWIADGFDGEIQSRLLALAAGLAPEDFEFSPMMRQFRNAEDAAHAHTQDDETRSAASQLPDRMLALMGNAHFLHYTILAIEDLPFERYEDLLNGFHDLEFPQLTDLAVLRQQATWGTHWPVAAAPIEIKNPVSSDVPTLILQGAYDTRTPVFMGRRAARELVNSTLVIVPQHGHEVWTSAANCAGRLATAFILDPEQELDLSGLEARRPRWALPGDANTEH